MELSSRIVREVNRYGARCVGSLLSIFRNAARIYAPRTEEIVRRGRQRQYGSRVWEGRQRAPHGNAHPALAFRLLVVFAICAAAGSAVLLTSDETTTASNPGKSAEASVRAGIDAHPLHSYEGPPTATSRFSLAPAISGARGADSGSGSLARNRLPAHVIPVAEPPELLAPLDVPLAPGERSATAIPVLAAILPAAAEINRGLQLALAARPLNTAPAMPAPLLKSTDWRSRTAPADERERGPTRAPSNPPLAAVQPGSAAAAGSAWGSVPLVNRIALRAPHAERSGRNPANGPERNAVTRVPPVATLAAVHPNRVNVGPKPLDESGAGVLNFPSPIRAPDGVPDDLGRRMRRTDGPASLSRLQEPRLVAIRANQIEVGHRRLDAIRNRALDSSLPLSPTDEVPNEQGGQVAQPRRLAPLLLPQDPVLAAVHPSQIEVGHRRLDAIRNSALESSLPLSPTDEGPNEQGGQVAQPRRLAPLLLPQDPVLAAVHPSQIEVGHRRLDAIRNGALESSLPLSPTDEVPNEQGGQVAQPQRLAPLLLPQDPVLAAIHPSQIEVGHRRLDAIRNSALESSLPLSPTDEGPNEQGGQVAQPQRLAPLFLPQDPVLAAIHPSQIEVGHRRLGAIRNGALDSSLPLSPTDEVPNEQGGQVAQPQRLAPLLLPQDPFLAAIHPSQIEVGHRRLDAIRNSALDSSLPLSPTDEVPNEQGGQVAQPQRLARLLLPQDPVLAVIHPSQIEVGHRRLDAIRNSALDSSLPLSPTDEVPNEQSGKVAQPQRLARLLLPQDPVPAAIHPSQAQLSHKQLEASASTPIATPATQRVSQAHSDRWSWPGNGAPEEPSSTRWRPDAVLAAFQPSNAAVRHEMRREGDTGFPNAPPAPRPLRWATGLFPRGESQRPRDAVPLAPDQAITARLPVAMQIGREAEIVPGTSPASDPAAPFGPLVSSPGRRSHGNSPEPPPAAESAPSLIVSTPTAFTGRHVQRVGVANAAVKVDPSELPGALRAPLSVPENSLSQSVRSTVPEAVPELPGASPVQAPVAIALRGLEAWLKPLLSSRLPALPPAYGPGDGAAGEAFEAGTGIGHESVDAPVLPLVRQSVEVAKGDSLLSILDTHAVPPSASLNAILRLRPRLDPKRIKAGDRVSFVLDELEGAVTVVELAVARIGGSERHHYWGSRTFEPGEVVEFGIVGDDAPEEGDSGLAARESLAEDPAAGNAPVAEAEEVPLFRHTMTVRRGDSLLGILQSNEVPAADALAAIRGMKPKFNPSRLQIGDRVSFVIDSPRQSDQDEAESRVLELSIAPKGESRAVHLWSSGENFTDRALLEIVDGIAGLEAPALAPAELILVEGQIAASFYRAAEQAGVSPGEIREFVRILSSQINFRRDIRKGDRFEALLQRQLGGPARVLFVALHNASRDHRYYRADFADGSSGYFDGEGHSSLNLISAEPIPGASISSRFGYRIHPVSRKRHFHSGVDFRATYGTPVRAAGSGVVIVKGWRGGFGRYLRIRHSGSYTTAYAHLRGYAKGITPGKHVKSGDIIGYVGSSGISTGPHLHFEVFEDGRPSDPLLLRNLPSPVLTGELLTAFLDMREELDDTIDRLRIGSLASAD